MSVYLVVLYEFKAKKENIRKKMKVLIRICITTNN